MSVDIRTTLKGPATWGFSFEKIANVVLGKKYELSLVICGDNLAQRMNREHRLPALKLRRAGKKTYRPNVLSFSLSKHEGEIFLNVRCAEREARKFGISVRERLALLFIHGCFHLKGLHHGRIMESEERRILRMFDMKWHGESTQE